LTRRRCANFGGSRPRSGQRLG